MKKTVTIIGLIISFNCFCQTDFIKTLNDEIYDIKVEGDTVWIGTGDGLLIKLGTDGTILDTVTVINDARDNALYSIAIDTNGVKWIATEGKGIFSYDGETLINYTTKDGLAFDFTTSIAVDKLNRKWIGTEGKGISVFDGKSWETIKVTDDSKEVVYSIKIDSNDSKWISTYFGIYEYQNSVLNTYFLNSYGYLSNGTLIDSKGNKWFGTSGKGVYKFDGTNWVNYTTEDGLIDNWVLSLYEDNQGNIWYGSKMWGISMFNGENWISIPKNELNNVEITSIIVIPNKLKSAGADNVWFGTKNGLYINRNFSLGINTANSADCFEVFPNPARDVISVDFIANTSSSFTISKFNGQVVDKGIISKNGTIDVSKLINGLYILELDNKKIKFIKQ